MSARLGVRLRPEVRDEFDHRFTALVQELAESDDPEGEPMGFFIALHRRRDDDPPARPATAVSRTLVQRRRAAAPAPAASSSHLQVRRGSRCPVP